MQENAILVLSDNRITFSVILKATSQDITWCRTWDEPSNIDLAEVQCPKMDWEAVTYRKGRSVFGNTWN